MVRTDNLQELDTMDIVHEYGDVTFLHHLALSDGTVASVFDAGGKRYFRAMEYTEDEDGSLDQACGYCTQDKGYMGERYRGLFGEFEQAVFYGS